MNHFKKVEAISTKCLIKYSINAHKTQNDPKDFSSSILQKCLEFIPTKSYFKFFRGTTQIYSLKSN